MGNIVSGSRNNTENHPIREQRTVVVDRSNQEYIISSVPEGRYLPNGDFYNQDKRFINISKSRAIQNLCHINGQTINYFPAENELVFEYDCIMDSLLKIYNNEALTLDENIVLNNNPIYKKEILKSLRKNITLNLKDINLSKEFVLELKPIGVESCKHKTKHLEPQSNKNYNNLDSNYTTQLTFCRQITESESNNTRDKRINTNKIEIRRQCVIYKGKAFEIRNVYGLSSNSKESANSQILEDRTNNKNKHESESCVVCLTNYRETILLPCRHACLCSDCSKMLLKMAHDCPICRSQIHSIVNIEGNK
ncbi:RING domain [Cryptosporidium xiaoi]|uniref:RING domain n=1 Tax=Cryptosporidium xiaoi TaxID=659607 RepID=A0AAV9XYJ9_9CRYT